MTNFCDFSALNVQNRYIAVFLGYFDVKDNEMYSRAPKFVIYEQKEFNKEKKKLTKLSSAQSTVEPSPAHCLLMAAVNYITAFKILFWRRWRRRHCV